MTETAELVQGTPEWHAARVGSLGASQIADAMAKTKTGWGASRANLVAQLVVERLTGTPTETFSNAAMQRGIDKEPEARDAYEFARNTDVKQVGLIRHPSIERTHASPDGLVSVDGLLEIKCPSSATHMETLLTKVIPQKYVSQMTWQMICTGREWCDYVSFDDRFPAHMQLFIKRVHRPDTEAVKALEGQVREFLKEVASKHAELEAAYGQAREAA